MAGICELKGMVLLSVPFKEYDRRMVVLTGQRGRITVFANGVRRQGNPMMGTCQAYAFGTFHCFEGRNSYTLQSADIDCYFDMTKDIDTSCYAAYFAELAEWYSLENQNARELLNLLYVTFKALENTRIPNELIRVIFELRALRFSGEYYEDMPGKPSQSAAYAYRYILFSPLEKLYTFLVTDEVLKELRAASAFQMHKFVPKSFHSLEILDSMNEFSLKPKNGA